MKQSLKKMLPGIILLILGSFIFFYPALSEYFARRKELSVTVNYTELVSKTGKERLQDEKKRAEEYNRASCPLISHQRTRLTGEIRLQPAGTVRS